MTLNLNPRKYNRLLFLLLLLTILLRTYFEWMLFDFGSDKIMQMATALNYVKGHGISIAYVLPSDLSGVVFEAIGLWPPGFAIGLAPLIKLGLTPVKASLVLETLSVIILFSSFYLIFKRLRSKIDHLIPVVFFIFYAFSLQPFNFLNASGLIALSFFSLSLHVLTRNMSEKPNLFSWFGLGLVSFLPSFFHFSYYPLSLALPSILVLYSFFFDTAKRFSATLNFTICLALIATQLLYQSSLPTGVNYLNTYHPDTPHAPYWENLHMFVNLPLNLITDGYLFKRTISSINYYLYLIVSIFIWLSLFILVYFILKEIYLKFKKEGLDWLKNPLLQFPTICLSLSSLLIFFIIFLSLKYPAESAAWMPNNVWTYVAEARYFAPIIITMPIALTMTLWKKELKQPLKTILLVLLTSCFLFSTAINLFYLHKYGAGTFEENYSKYYHHSLEFEYYLEQAKATSQDHLLIYAQSSRNDKYEYYSKLKNIPILKFSDLNKELNSSKPVKILFSRNNNLPCKENHLLDSLIEVHALNSIKEFPDLDLDIYELALQ